MGTDNNYLCNASLAQLNGCAYKMALRKQRIGVYGSREFRAYVKRGFISRVARNSTHIGIRSSLALDLVPSPSSWLLANNVGAFFVAGIQKSNRDLRLESCQLLHSG